MCTSGPHYGQRDVPKQRTRRYFCSEWVFGERCRVKVMILGFEVCKTWNKQVIINLSCLQLTQPSLTNKEA